MAGSRKTTPLAEASKGNKAVWRPEEVQFRYNPVAEGLELPATPRVIDFVAAERMPDPGRPGKVIDNRPENDKGNVLTAKRIRARARRAAARGERIPKEERDLVWKPIEDWDLEELAHGRPKAADGTFKGRRPNYITQEVREQALDMFKKQVRAQMNGQTVDALMVMSQILNNDEVDEKGKPVVPWSTKMDGAKFLLEHVVGKAVQPTTSDISVKLQGILGMAMVNPTEDGFALGHVGTRGDMPALEAGEDDDYEDAEVVFDDDEL